VINAVMTNSDADHGIVEDKQGFLKH